MTYTTLHGTTRQRARAWLCFWSALGWQVRADRNSDRDLIPQSAARLYAAQDWYWLGRYTEARAFPDPWEELLARADELLR